MISVEMGIANDEIPLRTFLSCLNQCFEMVLIANTPILLVVTVPMTPFLLALNCTIDTCPNGKK